MCIDYRWKLIEAHLTAWNCLVEVLRADISCWLSIQSREFDLITPEQNNCSAGSQAAVWVYKMAETQR